MISTSKGFYNASANHGKYIDMSLLTLSNYGNFLWQKKVVLTLCISMPPFPFHRLPKRKKMKGDKERKGGGEKKKRRN